MCFFYDLVLFLSCFWNKVLLYSHCHHKFHGSRFGNNSRVKFAFHRFIWNRHGCHSSSCIVWTLICAHCLNTNIICLFILFKHECCMFIRFVYTQKSCTWLSYLKNAWHSYLNNTNLWSNRFRMELKQTHEAYKFVMVDTSCFFFLPRFRTRFTWFGNITRFDSLCQLYKFHL
jgi:hypothetical protein